jgi:hypothetical protein
MHRWLVLLVAVVSLAAAPGAAASPVAETPIYGWQFPVHGWVQGVTPTETGRVHAIVSSGDSVYVGGNMLRAADHAGDEVQITYLASLSAATGELSAWRPQLDGRVLALATSDDGRYLFAGGDFRTVDGQPRGGLAAFDTETGELSPVIGTHTFGGEVDALAFAGGRLYVGGKFTSVDGDSRGRLARFDWDGGQFGLSSSWNPRADDNVLALAADAARGRLVVGGWQSTLNGRAAHFLGAVDLDSGATVAWASHPAAAWVMGLAGDPSRGTVYAAEAGPGGTAAAYDVATGERRWYEMSDGNVQAVGVVAGSPVFGMHGDFVSPVANRDLCEHCGTPRVHVGKLFMLDPDTGNLDRSFLPWVLGAPTCSYQGVWALAAGGGDLLAGGDFCRIGGREQQRFAIFPAKAPAAALQPGRRAPR